MASSRSIGRAARGLALAAALLAGCGGGTDAPVHGGPPGDWLLYQSIRGDTFTIRAARLDGSADVALPGRAASNAFGPALSGPAALVAFTSVQGGQVSLVLHAWSDDTERLLDLGALRPSAPAFSPDGSRLAFEGSDDTSNPDLYLLPVAGGTPVALAADPGSDAGPAWSADGQAIFFGSDRSGQWEVWRVGADGTGLAQVTTGSQLQGRVAVSPDGLTIAYTKNDALQAGHVVVHTLAGGAERVLFAEAGESDPAFDATGAHLAVVTRALGDPEIVIRDAATGSLVQRVTRADGVEATPAFAR